MQYPVHSRHLITFRDGHTETMTTTWYASDQPGPSIPEQLGPRYADVVRMSDPAPVARRAVVPNRFVVD